MKIINYRETGILIHRETRKSSVAGVHVDRYTFEIGDKSNEFDILKKSRYLDEVKTHSQTLAEAFEMLESHNEIELTNKPKRAHTSEVNWYTFSKV